MAERKSDDLYGSYPEKVEIPPKKTYSVLRVNPHKPSEVETLTIEAHKAMMPEGTHGAVAFFDFIIYPDGVPGADLHRVLFDVIDVEQVMRETNGKTLVVN